MPANLSMGGGNSGDTGPHLSGGTIGLAPTVRALTAGGRDDVLWDVLQQDTQPSYGFFLQSTTENPGGFTTIGERWTRGSSKNHMILAQIEEWFQTGVVGIRAASGSIAYDRLVYQPKPVGDLTYAEGSYRTPRGLARSEWRTSADRFSLAITVPANTTAEVWVPTGDGQTVRTPARATFERVEAGYTVFTVRAGRYTFQAA